jgi:hypothetical protein
MRHPNSLHEAVGHPPDVHVDVVELAFSLNSKAPAKVRGRYMGWTHLVLQSGSIEISTPHEMGWNLRMTGLAFVAVHAQRFMLELTKRKRRQDRRTPRETEFEKQLASFQKDLRFWGVSRRRRRADRFE